MRKKYGLFFTPALLGMLTWAMPASALADTGASQDQTGALAAAQDLGQSNTTQTITASIILKVQNQNQLESYIQSTTVPISPWYHQYLTVNQFKKLYAPSDVDVRAIQKYLSAYGIQSTVYPDNLDIQAVGTVDQFQKAFAFKMHDYKLDGQRFHAPKGHPLIPQRLVNEILTVAGLSNYANQSRPQSRPSIRMPGEETTKVVLPKDGSTATGVPGDFTVGDVANMYDVNPMYQQGVTGKGQTIGIVTLANFEPTDAYTYWDAIGLKSKPNRITQVHVDGGGDLSATAGSGETTLDVEQSGGLAPDANILVYDAPNTDAGFIDVFYKAVSDNIADTVSVSWGAPEAFYMNSLLTGGVDQTSELAAFHQAYMEAAAQGQSMFAAAGDSGAYDTNRDLPYPDFSQLISADSPASDPYMTAAGGTTVATTIHMKHGDVTIPKERAWAWDYLAPYMKDNYGLDPYQAGIFSVGGGGGVSSIWRRPWYQFLVPGMGDTEPHQSLDSLDDTKAVYGIPGNTHILSLPQHFAGRNAPDLSMNADPETGYLVYSSTDGGWISGYGGTSFVAPQLNGMTVLLDQSLGKRAGFLNPQLYSLSMFNGYGQNAPFNDITSGDNWFYQAGPGYDPATGIGTPNWANIAQDLKQIDHFGGFFG